MTPDKVYVACLLVSDVKDESKLVESRIALCAKCTLEIWVAYSTLRHIRELKAKAEFVCIDCSAKLNFPIAPAGDEQIRDSARYGIDISKFKKTPPTKEELKTLLERMRDG